ncbi:MAG: hypothetical protein ACE5FS_11105, partial [Paracoccaceae bacterium]
DRCMLLDDAPENWADTILRLIDRPEEARALAFANRTAITRSRALERQRDAWQGILGGGGGSRPSTGAR